MTEISWYRRLAWTPLIVPPILAFYSGGTDPRNRVWVLLWLTVVYGAPAYAAFAGLALKWLGRRPVESWRGFGLVAPLLFAVWFTLLQGGLFSLLDGNAARGFAWAAFMAGYAIPIGYVFVTLAAVGRPRSGAARGHSVSG